MVIINNSTEKQSFKTKRFQENIASYTKGNDVISATDFNLKNDITIDAKSVLLLELK
jgi:hypothetical protein